MSRKEFVQASSYVQARAAAPWAASLAWDASRKGFWGWSDAYQASQELGRLQQKARADLVVTRPGETSGHTVRSFLGISESDALERATSWAARGFVATFQTPQGAEIWQKLPAGHGVAGRIAPAAGRASAQGFAGSVSVA